MYGKAGFQLLREMYLQNQHNSPKVTENPHSGQLFRSILFTLFRLKMATKLILSGFKLSGSPTGLIDCFAWRN